MRDQGTARAGGHPVDTLLFDTMGTVVDVDGSIRRELAAILDQYARDDADRVAAEWDGLIREAMDAVDDGRSPWRSHLSLRATALDVLIETGTLPALTAAERHDLTSVIRTLDPWPDSPAALADLGEKATVVAFSNADLSELAALSQHAGLRWHTVISAEFARAYKPHPAMYRTALELLQSEPARTMVVAAHPWDLRAAARAGMLTAYVSRPFGEAPSGADRFTVTATDLADLNRQLVVESSEGRG